jgi:hypothetical protein
MLPPTIKGKARRREMRRGKENAFGDRYFLIFFIENEEGRGWPTVRVI